MEIVKIRVADGEKEYWLETLRQCQFEEMKFELVTENRDLTSDSTVLIALVTSLASTISILLTGILKILEARVNKKTGELYLKGKTGWELRLPASFSIEKIKEIQQAMKDSDVDEIHIVEINEASK